MNKLLALGSALVDQLAFVPEEFLTGVPGGKGGMELVDYPFMLELIQRLPAAPTRVPGGSAANTVVAAAELGLPSVLLTKVGADEAGDYYRRAVRQAGVEDHAFKTSPEVATGSCLALVTPDSERTMRTYLGASATMSIDDINVDDFRGCTYAHIEGYLLFNEQLMRHALKTARLAGCTISVDLAAPEVVRAAQAVLPELLTDYVDIVFANENEAAAYTGLTDEVAAVQRLGQICAVAVVKIGARGALICHNGEVIKVAAEPVKAIDTTGAGDLWAAGFLYGLLTGLDLPAAGRAGAAVAAEVVQVTGAVLPPAIWRKLRAKIGENR